MQAAAVAAFFFYRSWMHTLFHRDQRPTCKKIWSWPKFPVEFLRLNESRSLYTHMKTKRLWVYIIVECGRCSRMDMRAYLNETLLG